MSCRWVGVGKRSRRRQGGSGFPGLLAVGVVFAAVALSRWVSEHRVLATAAALAVVVVAVALLVWRVRARRVARQLQADRDSHLASTDAMTGRAFEDLVARLLIRDGWLKVQVSGGAGDLGADVTARHPRDGGLLVVQCKRYTSAAVSSPDMQRFLGTVYPHHRARYALFATTSRFTAPAATLAASQGIVCIDRGALGTWMAGQSLAVGAGALRSRRAA